MSFRRSPYRSGFKPMGRTRSDPPSNAVRSVGHLQLPARAWALDRPVCADKHAPRRIEQIGLEGHLAPRRANTDRSEVLSGITLLS